MQKEIQLTDKTLLVVGLPKEATHLVVDGNGSSTVRLSFYKNGWDWVPIPKGNYRLLGIYPELTEEQARQVVKPRLNAIYFNYVKDRYCGTLKTAKESFQSLMEREKCYTVNPYGDEPVLESYKKDGYESFYNEQEFEDDLKQWQEAQQRTFSKYAILIKSR